MYQKKRNIIISFKNTFHNCINYAITDFALLFLMFSPLFPIAFPGSLFIYPIFAFIFPKITNLPVISSISSNCFFLILFVISYLLLATTTTKIVVFCCLFSSISIFIILSVFCYFNKHPTLSLTLPSSLCFIYQRYIKAFPSLVVFILFL